LGTSAAQPFRPVPDRVLGQVDFGRSTGNLVDGRGFFVPWGVAVDTSVTPNRVYVQDALNNRVLGWSDVSRLANAAPADLVIGQPDFFSQTCDNGGISARSLCLGGFAVAGGLAVDASGNLYVSDFANHRVLEYDSPFTTDTVADRVFGQRGSFSTGTCLTVSNGAGWLEEDTLCTPRGLAVDPQGNLYVVANSSGGGWIVAFRDPLATDTVADRWFGGDCQAGSHPFTLCKPEGAAVDAAGNLYVADPPRNRAVAFASPWTTDFEPDFVLEDIPPDPSDLGTPRGVAVDAAGNVYVSDGTSRVVRFDTPFVSGTSADLNYSLRDLCRSSTLGSKPFCAITSVAVDSGGNLWVVDGVWNRVLRVAPAGGPPSLVLGQIDVTHFAPNFVDGRGLFAPASVAVDRGASPFPLYVVDVGNHRVLGWRDAEGFANGDPADLVLGQPDPFTPGCNTGGVSARSLCFDDNALRKTGGVAVDGAGNVYVADTANHRVLIYDDPFANDAVADEVLGQDGSFTSAACNLGGVSAGSLCRPVGVAVDRRGNLYVVDQDNDRVLQFNRPRATDASADRVFGQARFRDSRRCSAGRDRLCEPHDVAVDRAGNLYVSDRGNHRVLIFQSPLTDARADQVLGQRGSFEDGDCLQTRTTDLCSPTGITVDEDTGALYIADFGNHRVVRYLSPLRRPRTNRIFQGPLGPYDVAVDAAGNIYLADLNGHRVLAYDAPF
jgi:DNA-binding beta-propeller fold protein YncE